LQKPNRRLLNAKENKVCIIAPVHIWNDVRVFQKEGVALAQEGFKVSLIARIESRQTVKGVEVIPVKSSTSRMLRFFMLPAVFFQALRKKADIYHIHNPDTLPIGFLLKIFGKKVIYDTHEDFTQRILMRKWISDLAFFRPALAKAVGMAEKFLCRRIFDACIATQKGVVDRLGKRAYLIANPPRLDPLLFETVSGLAKKITTAWNGFRLVYIGAIEETRCLYEMIHAMHLINKDSGKARIWLIGSASESDLRIAQKTRGWEYVDYLPMMPQEEAFAYVSLSDIGLIVIQDVGDHRFTDPNKIYEYMTFGIPFLASDFPHWIERLAHTNAGVFIQPTSEQIARAVDRLINEPELLKQYGENGRLFVESYNWNNEFPKLLDIYNKH